MSFLPEEIAFQRDITTTVDVVEDPWGHLQVKAFGRWFMLEDVEQHISQQDIDAMRELAADIRADAEYEQRQQTLFGARYAEPV